VDTASRRLGAHGKRLGLIDEQRSAAEQTRWQRIDLAVRELERERWVPDAATRERMLAIGLVLETPASSADLLRRPEVGAEQLTAVSSRLAALDADERRITAETIMYAGYIERQRREAARVERAGRRRIPGDFVYRGLAGLSNELVEKLEAVRPEYLGRAARIDGMTPAALSLLAAHLEVRPS
jgi:tRNA uridine 5-carboxymethylaminomethyl modification enzyme